MKKKTYGIIYALVAAFCFASIPAMAKAAYAGGVNVLSLLSLRYLLAAIVLVPTTFLHKRNVHKRNELPSAKLVFKIALVAGVFLTLEAALYFYSLTLLPSPLAALILFTYPLIVNTISLLSGGKLTLRLGIAMLLCFTGLAVLLGPGLDQLNTVGIVCAFLAAVSYSVYLVLISKLITQVSPTHTNAIIAGSNAITMTVAVLLTGTLSLSFQPYVWIIIVMIVIISNLVGFQLFFKALKLLGPDKTSILNMSEPLFTVLIGVTILQEKLTAFQMLGAVILILGLFSFMYIKTVHNACGETGHEVA